MFRISALGHQGTIQVDIYPSTITYDTLVRAGVGCTSAFVSDEERIEGAATFEKNPPFAKGSRGINILPDTYFSPQAATPVCPRYCIWDNQGQR